MGDVKPLGRLTQVRLKELVSYDPEMGVCVWLVNKGKVKAGDVLGSPHEGYLRVTIDQIKYYLHQIAFLYMEGFIPPLIDHEDRVKSNNAWANLKEGTKQTNAANSKQNVRNSSGFKGVSFYATTKRWRASIRINGRERNLGRYASAQEAFAAYCVKAREAFGEFANLETA